MFTGLVEALGTVRSWQGGGVGGKLTIAAPFEALELGESISVSGVCLTVTHIHSFGFDADVSQETEKLTTIGRLKPGSRVNLERATQAHGRLGGHVVLGHVDGIGRVEVKKGVGEATEVSFRLEKELAPFVANKGSIAIDGVSLTLNSVADDERGVVVTVMLIPHTLSATTLQDLAAGTQVNVEVDVLARYVRRQLDLAKSPEGPYRVGHDDERLLGALKRSGFGGGGYA